MELITSFVPARQVEPRLPSPCVGSGGDLSGPGPASSAFTSSKRLRQDDAGAWISSPSSQMSVGSLSPPPPLLNGLSVNSASLSNNNSSGLSPVSCSSYETYSPRGPCEWRPLEHGSPFSFRRDSAALLAALRYQVPEATYVQVLQHRLTLSSASRRPSTLHCRSFEISPISSILRS